MSLILPIPTDVKLGFRRGIYNQYPSTHSSIHPDQLDDPKPKEADVKNVGRNNKP